MPGLSDCARHGSENRFNHRLRPTSASGCCDAWPEVSSVEPFVQKAAAGGYRDARACKKSDDDCLGGGVGDGGHASRDRDGDSRDSDGACWTCDSRTGHRHRGSDCLDW